MREEGLRGEGGAEWTALAVHGSRGAALQGAVMGMQKALTVLRDEKEVQESSGLVTPFAERQRLVGKPAWDALEQRYT